jgi:hypothetical protein
MARSKFRMSANVGTLIRVAGLWKFIGIAPGIGGTLRGSDDSPLLRCTHPSASQQRIGAQPANSMRLFVSPRFALSVAETMIVTRD